MIPARMGSQRLKEKNLRKLSGVPLITRAIRKCKEAGIFSEIWVNSEDAVFGEIAAAEEVPFHQRPAFLGNNRSTSEQYIAEFLKKHPCDYVVQVHSIAPLLSVAEIREFAGALGRDEFDSLLSIVNMQIECVYRSQPVNFSYTEKTNSQELEPVQRLSWSICAWRRRTYLKARAAGNCATYSGKVGFHPVSALAGHIIKTEQDLKIAEALLLLTPDP